MSVAILQPVGNVYITRVDPAEVISSMPVVLMVATDGSVLLQVPPAVPSLKVNDDPWHIFGVPAIATGDGLTVNIALAEQPVAVVAYAVVVVPLVS